MIEVVEDKSLPCFANPNAEKKSDKSFNIPFVLDSASGVNICGCREAVVSVTLDCNTVMKWFENTYKKAQMKGLVKFAIVDAATKMKVWIPVEALFVEGTTNLLSQRVLYKDNGFFAQISESQEVTTLPNRVKHIIWDFDMVSGLYQTMVGLPRSQLAVLQTAAQPARSLRLWHYRPEHANWQVIQEMASKGFVRGLELSKEDQGKKGQCYNCGICKDEKDVFSPHNGKESDKSI
ncbi:hypothetical protein GN244_ATG03655 [Phytophthora infestans]|uniref:GAG-pre-integrase domain-containing protein n=1 Tax=Phytophthora infestans TaxID=4787 RepID=A0A833TCL1_PHYIN|nr:hypothetical protein GN244_ATG03655 [Phytophthora infestans]